MKVSVQVNSYYNNEMSKKLLELCRDITGLDAVPGFDDDAEIILFSGRPVPGKKTKFMQSLSAGVNHLDFSKIPDNIIIASNADAYSIPVAETAIGLMLAWARKICISNYNIHNNNYKRLDYKEYVSLYNKSLGILGYGGIGRRTALIAKSFGMNIYAYSRSYKNDGISSYMEPEDIMKKSDFVLISLPLTKETANSINDKMLSLFRGLAIINVGRAGVVDRNSMLNFLRNHNDKYYLTDVWWNEPIINENIPDNVIITPHSAGMSDNIYQPAVAAIENIKNYINGKPKNIVKRSDYI
ncbi:2-hydroxyacid dehydrogenase [Picrophilus oshimae]|uniref:2-hydroxyacid dehydrogenase homolog n=1 Tax=Picrophilus torridus (strain ATCC 700027 / DSM 9790 / JCM 10055 / NBRC 100828 / KAW 2/3) TaxID=1122961 RepID=Q6L001_PICTO|nr:2-hydroxyacid dehydrogenase [Picrophilus oshimae]AAT43701.1 2-hydroxyacid dehydrogenase homolog [Picrophilus oshimae DSM 9789]SMD31325.1 glycerate dehydrogenase [Picrophilus oshimae DSM 9789]